MRTTATEAAATEAWKLLTQLWLNERPPRFPAVAARFDLSPMAMRVLYELEPGQERPMRDLAQNVGCDASNVTGIADRMEARGLIERRHAPGDRRVTLIALTAEGAELRLQVLERLFEPPEAIQRLPEADLRTLRDIVRRAVTNGQ